MPHAPCLAEDPAPTETHRVPRFVSINKDEMNLRTGPGERYPIDWVVKAKGWPLQIVAEYENWRRVRDWEGNQGWVHRTMLSGKPAAVVQVEQATLRRGPSEDDPPLALVRRGTQGTVKKCAHDWCQMDFGAAKGWVNIKTLWGVEVGSTPPAEDGDTEKDPVN